MHFNLVLLCFSGHFSKASFVPTLLQCGILRRKIDQRPAKAQLQQWDGGGPQAKPWRGRHSQRTIVRPACRN